MGKLPVLALSTALWISPAGSVILYDYRADEAAADSSWKYLTPGHLREAAFFGGSRAICANAAGPAGRTSDYFEKRFSVTPPRLCFRFHFAHDLSQVLEKLSPRTSPGPIQQCILNLAAVNYIDAPFEGHFLRYVLELKAQPPGPVTAAALKYQIIDPTSEKLVITRTSGAVRTIEPGRPYCFELMIALGADSTVTGIEFKTNGETDWAADLSALHYQLKYCFIKIGEFLNQYRFEGGLYYDNFGFGDGWMGSPPLRPLIAPQSGEFRPCRIVLPSPPYHNLDRGALLSATRYQIKSSGGDWTLPLYDSGPDSLARDSLNADLLLAPESTYEWRARHFDSRGNGSEWSLPSTLAYREDSTLQERRRHPRLHALHLSEPGSARPLQAAVRDKWYDVVVKWSSLPGWDSLAYAQIWMNNALYTGGMPKNRGGIFDPENSYAFNLALGPDQVWEKALPGQYKAYNIAGRRGRYLDASQNYYRINPKDSTLRCRFKFPREARPGPWAIRGVARDAYGLDSPLWMSVIELRESPAPSGFRRFFFPGIFLLAVGGAVVLAYLFVRKRPAPPSGSSPFPRKELRDELIFEKFDRLITESLARPWTLEELDSAMGMSHSHLFRIVKRKTRLNLKNYILKKKMDWAAQRLADPSKNVKSVMFEVGFTDAAYFSKVFKKIKGTAPSQYKE